MRQSALAEPLLMTGPQAVRAANSLRRPPQPNQPVPFPWDLAPKDSRPVCQSGSVASPAQAAQVVVVQYQVPDGFQFALKGRINAYTGTMVIGSGDALWTTDVNKQLNLTTPQGWTVEGLQAESFGVGSLTEGPFPVEGFLVFDPNDIVRVKATNVNVDAGAPNYFISVLMGWIWPTGK